jgi:hypothetical protein
MKRKGKKIDADRILSVSAIVIALTSVAVSIWEGHETRLHNRLSVRPRIGINGDVENTTFGLVLENNGLGPAVVRDYVLLLDGKPFEKKGFGGLDVLLDSLGLGGRLAAKGPIGPGSTVPAGGRENLFYLKREPSDDLMAVISEMEKRLRVQVRYASMYGERLESVWP